MYCLYKLTFPNGKCYIGITRQNLNDRWLCGHGYKVKKGKTSLMYEDIKRYGWKNIKTEVLIDYSMTKEEAAEKEIEYIRRYKSNNPQYGYNIMSGGFHATVPQSTREKISNSRKGNNYGMIGENAPTYGMNHSDDAKKKISNALKGKNNHMWGKHHTENTKDKIRKTHKDICKSVSQYDLEGNLIAEYPSIHVASAKTGINRQCISFALQGKYNTAGRCKWQYNTS